ncbi:MAG: hypothetical protein SCH39_08730 [Methanosarcinales archaeon]|nr:hypothetical protein [ANME-2 cluster archaeon]MDW7776400.1 hypothetical protein [Methanosarcinales archaeon]
MKNNQLNYLKDIVSESHQARTVRVAGEWILVFRAPAEDSDVIQSIKDLLLEMDIEDIRYLDSIVMVAGRKSIKVQSNLIEDLLGDRRNVELIVNMMKDELEREFGFMVYERGPHRRIAIRIPLHDIKDFTDTFTPMIKEVLLKKGNLTPDTIGDIISVYLIADETFVRLEPDVFFRELLDLPVEPAMQVDKKEQHRARSGIIYGESPQELVELALNKLKRYRKFRDILFIDAAGVTHDFDAFADNGDDSVLIKYLDTPTSDDVNIMKLYMNSLPAKNGWILTGEPAIEMEQTEGISLLTIKDL